MNNYINYMTTSSGCANYISSATDISKEFHLENYNENGNDYIIPDNIMNWFFSKEAMTISKVSLLLYYTESWYLSLKNRRLMNINFYANKYEVFSYELIHKYQRNEQISYNPRFSIDFSNEITEFLESVWLTYGNNTENSLLALIMSELPYSNAIKCAIGDNNVLIDDQIIKEYYLSIYIGNNETKTDK